MTVFLFKTEESDIADEYINELKERSQNPNMFINPFYIDVQRLRPLDNMTAVRIKPIYPNVSPIGWVMAVIGIIFQSKLALIVGLLISALGILWTSWFYFWIIKLGMRKKGFKGRIDIVPKSKALEVLIWDSVKS